jgi:hypothetical protein
LRTSRIDVSGSSDLACPAVAEIDRPLEADPRLYPTDAPYRDPRRDNHAGARLYSIDHLNDLCAGHRATSSPEPLLALVRSRIVMPSNAPLRYALPQASLSVPIWTCPEATTSYRESHCLALEYRMSRLPDHTTRRLVAEPTAWAFRECFHRARRCNRSTMGFGSPAMPHAGGCSSRSTPNAQTGSYGRFHLRNGNFWHVE